MNLMAIDAETYYDAEYSLKKKSITTESYVRDPRFKLHMIGVKYGDLPAECFKSFPREWTREVRTIPVAMVAHHAHFDGLILSHHCRVRPALWIDTLSMGRLVFPHLKSHSLGSLAATLGIGEKTVPYEDFKGVRDLRSVPGLYEKVEAGCNQDCELTYAVCKLLLPYVPKEELQIIDLTIRMFTEPALALDRHRLSAYLEKVKYDKETILQKLGVTKEDLQSAEKFSTLLRSLGVEPPVKQSPSDPSKYIYAFAKTDDGMKALEEDDDDRVQMLAAARLGSKSTIGETRAQRMLDMDTRGPMAVYLKAYGAHTLRWSGGDSMNWQNFTKGSDLRLSVMAPPGYVLVVGDCSQIECRLLNGLAGQHDVLEAFAAGRDLYSEGASRFYGRTVTKADKLERHLGKTLELGCGFGMGWLKFQTTCKRGALGGPPILLSDDESKRAVRSYRQSHPAITALWDYATSLLSGLVDPNFTMDIKPGVLRVGAQRIWGPNGAFLDYTNVFWDADECEFYMVTRRGKKKIYGALLVENVVQFLARIVLSQAMLKIAKRYKIVLSTHDEVVCVVPEAEAVEALDFILTTLKTPEPWCAGIPLDAEGGYDVRYSK